MASPVTQAAIARLGIQVALPSRGDISKGLSWMPGMLEGIFKRVDAAAFGSAKKAVSDQQTLLKNMQDEEYRGEKSRHSFIEKAEQEARSTSLARFKKHADGANSIARRAVTALKPTAGYGSQNFAMKLGIKQKDMQTDINNILKERTTIYGQIAGLTDLFQGKDETYRNKMLQDLKTEYQARQDIYADAKRQAELFDMNLRAGAYDEQQAKFGVEWAPGMKEGFADQVKEARHEAENLKVILDHFEELSGAPAKGIRDFNEEFKNQTTIAGKLKVKLEEMEHNYKNLAYTITVQVQNAFANYRDALQQTILTLTVFYYKLNETIRGFQEFERELINAQSIFQTTNETLFTLSNQIVRFGQEFGVSYENAAEGLYQFASAGLSAEDSIKVLNDTLKLSMAVQGDHNTISKLTTQVIFGFGLQMDEATEVTDKFAHAINKSLIEYQDLASAIKFSMPFFVSSGQSLDTLLGALQILTNRALEAGIAGRGLRQALAEFTQHADDNAAAFRQLGVEILDTEGNMFDLTHIAHQFNQALGEQATDMEVMMTLMDDLNIRGATAFIHLVQNADEFSAAVDDLKNSAGAAHEMAMIQQEALANQIQIIKNALMAPFLLADQQSVAEGQMNEFATAVHGVVQNLKDMLLVETENGVALTKLGYQIREVAITGIEELGKVLDRVVKLVLEFTDAGLINMNLLKLYFLPLSILVGAFEALGPDIVRVGLALHILNKTLPLITLSQWMYNAAVAASNLSMKIAFVHGHAYNIMGYSIIFTNSGLALSFWNLGAAVTGAFVGLVIGYKIGKWIGDTFGGLIPVVIGLAIAFAAMWAAASWGTNMPSTMAAIATLTAGLLGMVAGGLASYFTPPDDMGTLSGYEAQLEGNTVLAGTGAGGSSQETLYVRKLVYTDSNQSEYMQTQTSTQAGG